MPAGTGLGQSGGGGGMTPSELARLEYLEANEYKITYWASITTDSGTITKPTGSTIILDSFMSGVDALVETIVNGQPSGLSPVTGGGAYVTVSSFNTDGDYTLSGTPSATPVALLYIVTIPADQYQNLDLTKVITAEPVNPIVQTITNGDTTHAPSSDAVYDALALKEDLANKSSSYTLSSTTTYANTKALVDGLATKLSSTAKFATVRCNHTALSPADSTSYFFGAFNNTASTTSSLLRRFVAPFTGNITSVGINVFVATSTGSNEGATLKINNVTATTSVTLSASLKYDAAGNFYAETLASPLAVTAGDVLEVQVDMPAFTSNPTGVGHIVDINFKG